MTVVTVVVKHNDRLALQLVGSCTNWLPFVSRFDTDLFDAAVAAHRRYKQAREAMDGFVWPHGNKVRSDRWKAAKREHARLYDELESTWRALSEARQALTSAVVAGIVRDEEGARR